MIWGVTPFMETVGNPHKVISKGFNGTFMGDYFIY